jgi:hypothetical protein
MTIERAGFLRIVAACAALLFGVATIRAGGSVLFGGDAARRAAGAYVPFVLWFNFVAGFAYLVAGAALWTRRPWAGALAWTIAATTAIVFAALGVHVALGGAYEVRTVAAMALRTAAWTGIALVATRLGPRPA